MSFRFPDLPAEAWYKSPKAGFMLCYLGLTVVNVIALVDPSQTSRDRGFGVPGLAAVISSTFIIASLLCFADQILESQEWFLEYIFLPFLAWGYFTFGLASFIDVLGEPGGSFIYGISYMAFGGLFHARWRVQASRFRFTRSAFDRSQLLAAAEAYVANKGYSSDSSGVEDKFPEEK